MWQYCFSNHYFKSRIHMWEGMQRRCVRENQLTCGKECRDVHYMEERGFINLTRQIALHNVLFSCSLISIHKLTCIYETSRRHEGSVYPVGQEDTTVLWHLHMRHPSAQVLQRLSQQVKSSFNFNKVHCCDVCHRSKQCKLPFNISYNKAGNSFVLTLLFVGEISCWITQWLTLLSHFCWWLYMSNMGIFLWKIKLKRWGTCKFLKHGETQYITRVKECEAIIGPNLRIVHCAQWILQQEGILHETSCVGTPQQNGRVWIMKKNNKKIIQLVNKMKSKVSLIKFLPLNQWFKLNGRMSQPNWMTWEHVRDSHLSTIIVMQQQKSNHARHQVHQPLHSSGKAVCPISNYAN